eukprot:2593681-Prymnesium_polylepis.2
MVTFDMCHNIATRQWEHKTLLQRLTPSAGRREKNEPGGEAPFLEDPLGARASHDDLREPRPPVATVCRQGGRGHLFARSPQ